MLPIALQHIHCSIFNYFAYTEAIFIQLVHDNLSKRSTCSAAIQKPDKLM